MIRRFKDGRIYRFADVVLPRRGYFHPLHHTLTIRYCPGGNKGTGATWLERRRKLAREADRITREANRVIARTEEPWGLRFAIAGSVVTVGRVGLFMSDWKKMAMTGRLNRRGRRQAAMKRHWLTQPHRSKTGPGGREDET